MDFNKAQIELIKTYIKIVRSEKIQIPSIEDVERNGITYGKLEYHFGNLGKLRKAAKEYAPEVFRNIIDDEIYNPKIFARLREKASEFSKFVITTAVTGCEVHKGFYQNLRRYCEENNALLLILPSTDPAAIAGWAGMDPCLRANGEQIVMQDLALNNNIWISSIKLSAKQIDPITGLGRIGQRHGSFIYASPKQRLKLIATSNTGKLPKALMTTGAITKPDYNTERYMSERTAYISTMDHVIGAVIVELEPNGHYHFRQIQAEKSGNFVDLGKYYKLEGTSTLTPEAIVLGDYHAGETDPVAEKAFLEVIQELKPRTIVFHDMFNGLSINHHEKHQHILKAIRAMNDELNLEAEIKKVSDALNMYSPLAEELIVVKSNHDEFLSRYLEEGMYIKDPHNLRISLRLALAMLDGLDPLKEGTAMCGLKAKNVKWLQRDEDYKVARVELGAHGDLGGNGSRGNLRSMEHSYGNSVNGHSHTPEILRGCYQVGTLSYLKLDYNRGPSSWLQTSCLVYPNGSRQLINAIDGKWRA